MKGANKSALVVAGGYASLMAERVSPLLGKNRVGDER